MAMGVFTDTTLPSGTQITGNVSEKFKASTISPEYPKGVVVDNLWAIVLMGTAGGIAVSILTQSTVTIGAYIFCFVFWSTYLNLISILSTGGFLANATLAGFVGIGTGVMVFVFIAAVAGMFSGSG